MPLSNPCHCNSPDSACTRAGRPMTPHLWQLCQRSAAYRALWDARACTFLGPATGALAPCGRCPGGTLRQLKVFDCTHPNHTETTLAACAHCPDQLSSRTPLDYVI